MSSCAGMGGPSTHVACEHALPCEIVVDELADEAELMLKLIAVKLDDARTRLVEDVEIDDGVVEEVGADTWEVHDDWDIVGGEVVRGPNAR